jgi:hypothetical protein
MKYKTLVCIILIFLQNFESQAQTNAKTVLPKKTFYRSIFAEIGGVGGIYSVNLEANAAIPKFRFLYFSLAGGICRLKANDLYWQSIPIRLKAGLKFHKFHVEYGYNKILMWSDSNKSYYLFQMIPTRFYSYGIGCDFSKRFYSGIEVFKISRYNQDNDNFLMTINKDLYNFKTAYWWSGLKIGYRF